MKKKHWIIIILAIIIGLLAAIFLMPGKIGDESNNNQDQGTEDLQEQATQDTNK